MSKYIRTENGIFEVKYNKYVEMWCDIKTHQGFILDNMISKEDYKLSDTIEELCDEFVGIYQNICEVVVDYHEWYKYDILYGAIWTDKVLIYVAKMNEEGELELI